MRNRPMSRRVAASFLMFAAVLIVMVQPSPVHAQSSSLPTIVVTEHPQGNIRMERSDLSLSGFQTGPLTFEVQILDAANRPVPDDLYGPNTFFMVDITLRNPRGEVVPGAIDSIPTQNGIARFEGIVLRVTPDFYEVTITARIVFAVEGLGSTSLTLGSTFGGQYMIGVEPTPTPTATPTINPYAGTPPALLTHMAMMYGVGTALATTPEPTVYCPPSDLFNCQYPTSTPTPTGTATPPPVISPVDGDHTVALDARGGSFQNEVSGPSGDTSDLVDFVFGIGAITQTTTYSVTLTCPENVNAVATVVATGAVIACGRGGSVTVDPVNSVVRLAVTSLSAREQIRTPYELSIAPGR